MLSMRNNFFQTHIIVHYLNARQYIHRSPKNVFFEIYGKVHLRERALNLRFLRKIHMKPCCQLLKYSKNFSILPKRDLLSLGNLMLSTHIDMPTD